MASPPSKIITIVGATGNQGSSVAHTFLKLANWHVRCLTRNPSSDVARALAVDGAEVVQGDLGDPLSLKNAFKDANAIFLNIDFWTTYHQRKAALDAAGQGTESLSQDAFDAETMKGKNAVDAAATIPSLERLVYSGLTPIRKASNGKFSQSFHSQAKDWVFEYVENQYPKLADKTSMIVLGAYNTNRLMSPTYDPNTGKWAFVSPLEKDTRLPVVDARESTGPFVRALIEDEPPRTKLLAYDSYLTMEQIVLEWSGASGKEGMLVSMSIHKMHEDFGLSYEVLEPAAFLAEFPYTAGLDGIIEPHQLKKQVKTKSFEQWLKERNWGDILSV